MAAFWKKITRKTTNEGNLEVLAVRAETNSLGTFKRNLTILVSDAMEDTVEAYTPEELQTFVESSCDMAELDTGLTADSYPTEP